MTELNEEKACTECGETIRASAEICPKCGVRQFHVNKTSSGAHGKTILGFPFLTLQDGEVITATARRHWFPYLFTAIVAMAFADYHLGKSDSGFVGILIVSFLICAISFGFYYFARIDNKMIVTDRRVITKTGFINIKTIEFNMSKIETIGFIQNFFGQFFDFGSLVVIGTGGTKETVRDIENPLGIRKAIVASLKT